jgi:cytochrome P450
MKKANQRLQLVEAIKPSSYLPTTQFPVLKLIPNICVPSRHLAHVAHQGITATFTKAGELVERRRKAGDIRNSLLDQLLNGAIKPDVPLTLSQRDSGLLGPLHQGASGTSSGAPLTSLIFLAKNPDVQVKARVELDRVCGADRIPQWSEFAALPYIRCIVKEGLRIRPV